MNSSYPQIITHRGIDQDNKEGPSESTLEAFQKHLDEGYSLEFDLNFTKDGIVIWHDSTTKRISPSNETKISQLSTKQFLTLSTPQKTFCTLQQLLTLISKYQNRSHALHFKGNLQQEDKTFLIVDILKQFPETLPQLFLFDLKPTTAQTIRQCLPNLQLGASVAHPYDIERFNKYASGTLLTLEQVIQYRSLYNIAWLDEWDRKNRNGQTKELYTKENFELLKGHGFKIAVVSPELHATSPSLLGNESHEDAEDQKNLFERIRKIFSFPPDLICTDYPESLSGKKYQLEFNPLYDNLLCN